MRRGAQRGQAIVLVAVILTVLFGFVGLAMDGGRGYLDRRHVQASVDSAALAAAYNYMNHHDYAQAEALTTFGRIGVKVWINKGEILPPTAEEIAARIQTADDLEGEGA